MPGFEADHRASARSRGLAARRCRRRETTPARRAIRPSISSCLPAIWRGSACSCCARASGAASACSMRRGCAGPTGLVTGAAEVARTSPFVEGLGYGYLMVDIRCGGALASGLSLAGIRRVAPSVSSSRSCRRGISSSRTRLRRRRSAMCRRKGTCAKYCLQRWRWWGPN